MCLALDTILSDRQTHDARERFAHIFRQLMAVKTLSSTQDKRPCPHSRKVADGLNQLAHTHQESLHTLTRHNTYSRHIIGIDENWIGFICRWEKNITSSIHGHPSFAYYQVLAGCISMDIFEPVSEVAARQVSSSEMCAGDSICSITREGQYDNLVHRVRTENAPVFTLHLYSDNPAKGRVFQAVRTTGFTITDCPSYLMSMTVMRTSKCSPLNGVRVDQTNPLPEIQTDIIDRI